MAAMKTEVKKFVLNFDFKDSKFSATCDDAEFERSLLCDELSQEYAKVELVKQFIKSQNYNETTNRKIWFYDMKQNTNTTTIYCAPIIDLKPHACDLETMQAALTRAKISASFFDSQIEKHLESVGIKTTRANIRAYRESYKDQISKLLLEEILTERSTAYITRWFDKVNGNSYFSLNLSSGRFAINVPMIYGYGSAENLIIRALRLECPRTMRARDVLRAAGINVVDLGYRTKGELYKAAFHI